jgi:hypothetical protein
MHRQLERVAQRRVLAGPAMEIDWSSTDSFMA